MSIYTGRAPLSDAPAAVSVQIFWAVALSLLTGWMWRKASMRVMTQGG
jgi:ABC-2 type transport system permease protein